MDNSDNEMNVYEKLLDIAKESAERDARAEARMEDFDRRLVELEKQQKTFDQQLRENSELMHDIKSVLKEFQTKQNNDWVHFQNIEKKIMDDKNDGNVLRKACTERFDQLEKNVQSITDMPKNIVWQWVVKAFEMFMIALIGGGVAYLLAIMGIKK